jgi:ABC-type transport system involved in cytochrome c biogenesis permease subunit
LALVSDLARFAVRSASRGWMTFGLMALAWTVQTIYLANRAHGSGTLPLTTPFESLLVLSWLLGAIGLYLVARAPKAAVGVFVLPVVVGLLAAAGALSNRAAWLDTPGVASFWGTVHGLLLLAGELCSCVAFVTGLMYLIQSRRLKHKRPASGFLPLPSLEQSERVNRAAITLAFPLLTAGLCTGVALVILLRGKSAVPIGWADPKVISTIAAWLASGVLLHARFRPEMRGRRVMILTLLSFVFMVFTLIGMDLFRLPTAHGRKTTANPPAKSLAGESEAHGGSTS